MHLPTILRWLAFPLQLFPQNMQTSPLHSHITPSTVFSLLILSTRRLHIKRIFIFGEIFNNWGMIRLVIDEHIEIWVIDFFINFIFFLVDWKMLTLIPCIWFDVEQMFTMCYWCPKIGVLALGQCWCLLPCSTIGPHFLQIIHNFHLLPCPSKSSRRFILLQMTRLSLKTGWWRFMIMCIEINLSPCSFLKPHCSIIILCMKLRTYPTLLMEEFRWPIIGFNYHFFILNILISWHYFLFWLFLHWFTISSH